LLPRGEAVFKRDILSRAKFLPGLSPFSLADFLLQGTGTLVITTDS
jgi:hypothetical protein